jgi:hypothetical protein
MSKDRLEDIMEEEVDTSDDKPQVFKSWNTWYALLIFALVLLVVLFYLFTQHYSA